MSRIRSVHPGLWTDEAFMSLSAHGRLLLIGLWTEAFDDGVFEWKPLTLKAKLFPVDAVDVGELLLALVEAGVIARLDSQPKQPGVIRNFQRFQRPKKPNSSGMLPDEWRDYVGASSTESASSDYGSEPVPHQFPTSTEKSPQMEDGGGKMEEDKTPLAPQGASEAMFSELVKAFPHNPNSSDTASLRAFLKLSAEDQAAVVVAGKRFRAWWAEDCAARGELQEDRETFAPGLAKWISSGTWKQAAALRVKSEEAGIVVPMVKLDRENDHDLWLACEAVTGRKAPTDGFEWSFRREVVDQARLRLGSPESEREAS